MTAAKRTAKKAASSKGGGLRVTAPLIEVPVGSQVLQFRLGDILPRGIDPERLEHLRDLGFVDGGESAADDVQE